jgi:hypothetical protein
MPDFSGAFISTGETFFLMPSFEHPYKAHPTLTGMTPFRTRHHPQFPFSLEQTSKKKSSTIDLDRAGSNPIAASMVELLNESVPKTSWSFHNGTVKNALDLCISSSSLMARSTTSRRSIHEDTEMFFDNGHDRIDVRLNVSSIYRLEMSSALLAFQML